MKSYTDLDQSKVLAKKLPLESADMFYTSLNSDYPWIWIDKHLMEVGDIPCWSLAALVNYLKNRYCVRLEHDGIAWSITCIEYDTEKEYNLYMFNDPVDACWSMILRLDRDITN